MTQPLLPVCVDLDGTFIRTDVLQESLRVFLRRWPWKIFLLPFWFLSGRAYLKRRVAEEIDLDIQALPLVDAFYRYLMVLKGKGHLLYLVTAADEKYARQIAKYYPIFEGVMASQGTTNLRSHQKARALVDRFGEKGFIYAGNSRHDLPVWSKAGGVIVVNLPFYLKPIVKKLYPSAKRFD